MKEKQASVPMRIRIPPHLYRWIVASAKRDSRSMNGQIRHALQRIKDEDSSGSGRGAA